MKALTTFIAIALLAFSTTACSQQHTYRSGGFGSKTVKASKNYVTKDIEVEQKICQCCAMPIDETTFGTEADGSKNEEIGRAHV